jgi:hypothetical protein
MNHLWLDGVEGSEPFTRKASKLYKIKGFGRGGGIRTPDPLLPKQMRYQTALRPDIGFFPGTEAHIRL